MHAQVEGRRRSIQFDGRTVTISIAIKDSWNFPGDQHNRFPVSKISGIAHLPATAWRPGQVDFTVDGGSTEIVRNVPMFADKLGPYSFRYATGQAEAVSELVEAIRQAQRDLLPRAARPARTA